MKMTKTEFKAAAKDAMGRARIAGRLAARRVVDATDAALVEAGKAARQRQRQRAAKTAFKAAGKAALVAGTVVAAALAVRAARAKKAAT
ncbi:MAG TPA: hypothetical protein VLV16_02895 [Gemmatimonadales bacterium]|nr:hypothetical protein [Gemmatimonadales bacterium]